MEGQSPLLTPCAGAFIFTNFERLLHSRLKMDFLLVGNQALVKQPACMTSSYRLFFFVLTFLFLQGAFAQKTEHFTIQCSNTPLRAVLQKLETDYALSFSYDDQAVEGIALSVSFRGLPLREALQRVFHNTGLDFEILDGQNILLKKSDKPAPPPEQQLCGKILDRETGEPLPGATAFIRNSPHGTTADERGNFSLKGDFGKYDSLEISYLGYQRQVFPLKKMVDKPCAEFRLAFAPTLIPDVLVWDFATDMISLDGKSDFSLKKDKMTTLPGWGEPDVLRTLQLLPGIASADESASRLNVRGGTPDQNLVLWDGIPIYHTGHFFGLYDAFNPFVVQEVDVWRGNFGAEYGGRNASVIDIKGKPELAGDGGGGVGMNLLSVQGYLEVPVKKGKSSLLVAGRHSYLDLISNQTYRNLFNQVFQNGRIALEEQELKNSEFYAWSPAFSYGDFNLKLRLKGKKQRESAFSLFYGADRLDYRFAYDDSTYFSATDDHLSAQNFGFSWQHWARWSPQFRVKYKAAISSFANDYFFQWGDDRQRPYLYRYDSRNRMTDFTAQFHHGWQVSERHEMSFGYQLTVQEASLVLRDTNVVAQAGNLWLNDTTRSGLHTFYAEFVYRVSPRFDFTLGIRENHFPSRGIYYSEPRVNFQWRPFAKKSSEGEPTGSERFVVKGGFGRYWQFVFQIVDLVGDLGVGEPLWALTHDDIPAQELWQWSLGWSAKGKSWLFDAEFYLKTNRNLTSLNLEVDPGFERPWTFDGRSTAIGYDLLFRKRWRRYSLWLAWSLASVQLTYPELNNGLPYPARHDIPQRLNWVNTFSWPHWDISANLSLRSGTPYSIPAVAQVPCDFCTADSLTYAFQYDRLNANRLPGSPRLDLGVTYKFGKKQWKGRAGLSVYNFFNRLILLDRDFLLETPPADAPQTEYNVQEVNRVAARATPNLFLQFEW
jgi:hypothetical protein